MTAIDLLISSNEKVQEGIKKIFDGYVDVQKGCSKIKKQVRKRNINLGGKK